MGSLISVDIELHEISEFLKRVYAAVDSEYSLLMKRAESGEFVHEDEEANAFFSPRMSEQIAIRAALHERINSIVEWELYAMAQKPFADVKQKSKSEHFRLIWDLRREEIQRLIEDYYGIKFSSLSGSSEVEQVRKVINAFKHRKGFKDYRRDRDISDPTPFGKFDLDRRTVANCLSGARTFLRDLRSACHIR